jgi:2-dehydropantoate 2-reductase
MLVERMMKIAILGCGSLGSTFGGILTEAGIDVVMVNPLNRHMQAMIEQGLTLVENGEERLVRVRAVAEPALVGPVDLIIVLVKSHATRKAIESARALMGSHTIALSLQNGLGNEDVLAEYFGGESVIGGKTYVGGVMNAPGRVQVGVRGKRTFIGELDGRASDRTRQIATIFNRAGLQTEIHADIQSLIWQKLLVNVSTGAICGITGLTYGQLLQVPEVIACATAAVAEALAVARAAGVSLEVKEPRQVLDQAVAGLPCDFKTSILQDLERGRLTEIDFINGAVVREGDRLGIPTPVNQTLVAGIKGIEFGLRKN